MQPRSVWVPSSLTEFDGRCSASEAHLWLLSLDRPPQAADELDATLSPDEEQRASRFVFESDRRRYRAAHGQLRMIIGRYLGAPAHSLRFETGAAGKPGLVQEPASRGLTFNLSHSGDHALVGVTMHAAIGVDIEQVRPMPELDSLAKANFAAHETTALSRLPHSLTLEGFFACWTRKEAIVKAIGGGLSIPLAEFEVTVDPRKPAALLSMPHQASASDWTLWGDQPQPGLWVALAVHANPVGIHCFRLAR